MTPRWNLALVFVMTTLVGCTTPPPLGHEKLVYATVGASDALGVGAFPLTNGYTFRIQDELKDQGRDVATFHIGIPAANADLINKSIQSAIDKGLSAELATVWVGANDLINGVPVETFAIELEQLLSGLQNDMSAYVVIATLPSLPDLPSFIEEPLPEVTKARVDQFNAVIKSRATAFGIPIVDLADDAIEAHLVYDFDGFHPDDEGHDRLAKLFLNVIRPAL